MEHPPKKHPLKRMRKLDEEDGEGGSDYKRKALNAQAHREIIETGQLTNCFQCGNTLHIERGAYVLECKAVSTPIATC
jgi:hypothetical protein